jgi:hypothetical protein
VAHGGPVRVVLAPRPAQGLHVGGHHRGHHLQARADRDRQQALPHIRGDLVHHHAHHIRHHRPDPTGLDRLPVARRARPARPGRLLLIVLAHGGPLSLGVLGGSPDTYHSVGLRRGTATQVPRDPGQPLVDRSISLLSALTVCGIGQQPFVLVGHSLGGVMVKAMLHHSVTMADQFASFHKQLAGVAFFATPHRGAPIAEFVARLGSAGLSPLLTTLAPGDAELLRLQDTWYRNYTNDVALDNIAFAETRPTTLKGFRGKGITVVPREYSDPYLAHQTVIPLDADHISIAKLADPADPAYLALERFVTACLAGGHSPVETRSSAFPAATAVNGERSDQDADSASPGPDPPSGGVQPQFPQDPARTDHLVRGPAPQRLQPLRRSLVDSEVLPSREVASRKAETEAGIWPIPPPGARYRFEALGRPAPRSASHRRAPSYLLDSIYEVVPFRDRGERQVLEAWLDDPAPRASMQLVYGEGGQGKTRLARHVARNAAGRDWYVVQAFERAGPALRRGERAGSGRLLVIVDYAERWTVDVLKQMVVDLADEAGVQCLRVLLLARSDYWLWDLITSELDREVDHLAVPVRLGRFTTGALELAAAFEAAVGAFQSAMQVQPVALAVPRTWEGAASSPLGLHMAALAAVCAHEDRYAVPSDANLSEFLLTHERKYWSAGVATDMPALTASAQLDRVSRTVLIATLFGSFTSSADARQLLRAAQLADSDADAQSLIDRHSQLYPVEPLSTSCDRAFTPYLRPLQPDRFAEDFVAECVSRPADRALILDLVQQVTFSGPAKLLKSALFFLATAAARHPNVDLLLDEIPGMSNAYVHINSQGIRYYLQRTSVTLRGGKPQTIYFFSKVRYSTHGEPAALPEDRIVKEDPRNGFLTISRH